MLHTSTEHERKMLPTDLSDDDGSNRSNTSKSDSESCNTTHFSDKFSAIVLIQSM